MNKWIMYLRKSREDEGLEALGEGETLSKHKKALLKFARENDLNIIQIYEEIVSGGSLAHRPEMQKLLSDIETGEYSGVLCMDIDRLGRGDMQEQGLILNTFKKYNAKICTPYKTYDLNNEMDEEFSELKTFMSRFELRTITRRMQSGRVRSIDAGNYQSPTPPFGYIIKDLGKEGRTLLPHPDQAPVVQLIFEMYTQENIGRTSIAARLNQLGYKPAIHHIWHGKLVANILRNPVYAGLIVWRRHKKEKTATGRIQSEMLPEEKWIIAKGKHEPLVTEEVFYAADRIRKGKHKVPVTSNKKIMNPLAGLVECQVCGSTMQYQGYNTKKYYDPFIQCPRFCGNSSAKMKYVEEAVVSAIENWLDKYKLKFKQAKVDSINIMLYQKNIIELQKELNKLILQRNNIYDLYERGEYLREMFLDRSNYISSKINEVESAIVANQETIKNEEDNMKNHKDVIPHIEQVLSMYWSADPGQKNTLLKSILNKVVFRKLKTQRNREFTLDIYPWIDIP